MYVHYPMEHTLVQPKAVHRLDCFTRMGVSGRMERDLQGSEDGKTPRRSQRLGVKAVSRWNLTRTLLRCAWYYIIFKERKQKKHAAPFAALGNKPEQSEAAEEGEDHMQAISRTVRLCPLLHQYSTHVRSLSSFFYAAVVRRRTNLDKCNHLHLATPPVLPQLFRSCRHDASSRRQLDAYNSLSLSYSGIEGY